MPESPTRCPCGSSLAFEACCKPILDGAPAPSADALMRSRYTGFATGHVAHLVRSHAKEISANERAEMEAWCKTTRWFNLKIVKTERGVGEDLEGWVEFEARFLEDHDAWVITERSHFQKRDGYWTYIDGLSRRIRERKPGRNEPCPCGSEQRFKRCHGN